MSATERDSSVHAQYEAYPYPARDPRDEAKRLIVGSPSDLREVNHYLFRGVRDFSRPFTALVAGGGTGDATILLAQQLSEQGAQHRVVYLDLSQASRRVAEARAAARGLTNITFVSGSLLQVGELAPGPYDYIDCCGVLHHLEDPGAGLAALAAALSPEGGIGLMVYGEYGRRGVYELQALLRALAPDAPLAERVALARRLLAQLPQSNGFKRNPFLADHRQSDAELVDLLLHARDRAYRVAELLDLVSGAGLTPVTFIEALRYEPESYLSDPQLVARLAALSAGERWAAAEALAGNMKTHVLYATRATGPTQARPDRDRVPLLTKTDGATLSRAVAKDLTLKVDVGGLSLKRALPRLAPAILQRIDGARSLGAIHGDLQAANPAIDATAFQAAFAELYAVLNGFNLLLLK